MDSERTTDKRRLPGMEDSLHLGAGSFKKGLAIQQAAGNLRPCGAEGLGAQGLVDGPGGSPMKQSLWKGGL